MLCTTQEFLINSNKIDKLTEDLEICAESPIRDGSIVIEQLKLLLQVEICHKQLQEFALYFHVPVR